VRDLLPRSTFLFLPLIPLSNPICSPIPPKMEVHIKLINNNVLEITHHTANKFGSHREAKVPIFKQSDMKSSQRTSKKKGKSKTHWCLSETEGVSSEDRKKMGGTTRRGRRMVNGRSEPGEDAVFKAFAPPEIPILDQLRKLLVFLKL
jgi:hypothetical protein